ncbi:putative orfan [Tupanvirus soda lake]|uniref:Orfan n=2 Tax=Tupanvirus TaxID=2094720 RepID=A0AC62AB73_9VIRU|nr:putative orfan [Tupanvirus soda lake]QKU34903.1 putative orfan [Tupanvirus soda lake]
MVYFNDYMMLSVISKSGLEDKYPQVKKYKQIVSDFFLIKFKAYSEYQRAGRSFIGKCSKYCRNQFGMDYSSNPPVRINFEQFMDKYFVRDKRVFIIYFKRDISELASVKFLEEFTGKSIIDILAIFDCINMKSDITYHIKNDISVYQNVLKIINTHMLVYLSKVFYLLDIAIKTNTTQMLCQLYVNTNYSPLHGYLKKFTNIFSVNLKNGTNVSEIINDLDPDDIKKKFDHTGSHHDITTGLCKIYECKKKLYDYFTNKTSADILAICQKYPDIDILIGHYFLTNRVVKKDFVINHLLKLDNFVIIYYLGENISVYDNEITQIKNLKAHTNNFTQSKIIVEI